MNTVVRTRPTIMAGRKRSRRIVHPRGRSAPAAQPVDYEYQTTDIGQGRFYKHRCGQDGECRARPIATVKPHRCREEDWFDQMDKVRGGKRQSDCHSRNDERIARSACTRANRRPTNDKRVPDRQAKATDDINEGRDSEETEHDLAKTHGAEAIEIAEINARPQPTGAKMGETQDSSRIGVREIRKRHQMRPSSDCQHYHFDDQDGIKPSMGHAPRLFWTIWP